MRGLYNALYKYIIVYSIVIQFLLKPERATEESTCC